MKLRFFTVSILLTAAFLVLTTTSIASAQSTSQNSTSCDDVKNFTQEPAVFVDMTNPGDINYCPGNKTTAKHAKCNGKDNGPCGVPSAFPNGQTLKFVLIHYNPLLKSCKPSFADVSTPEPDLSSFLSSLGAVPSGNKTPSPAAPGKPTTPASTPQITTMSNKIKSNAKLPEGIAGLVGVTPSKTPQQCMDDYNVTRQNAVDLISAANIFSTVVTQAVKDSQTKIDAYNSFVLNANNATSGWRVLLDESKTLKQISPALPVFTKTMSDSAFAQLANDPTQSQFAKDSLKVDSLKKVLSDEYGKDFTTVATELAAEAKTEAGHLKPSSECDKDQDVTSKIKDDSAQLANIYQDPKSSFATTWTAQITKIAEMSTSLASAITDAQTKLQQADATSENVYDVADNSQSTDTVTLTCTNQSLLLVPVTIGESGAVADKNAQPAAPAAKTGASPKTTNTTGQQTTTDPAKQQTPASQTYTYRKLQFGYGPRVYESAGMVFSPLAQHSYGTAAAGSSPSCPASTPSVTYTGCIVDDSASNWRILPMMVVSYRLGEQESKKARDLTPYISFGATVKSSASTGTSLEYLLGPSWAIAHRYLFLTVGGYAGQVTHLGGGLVLGGQTATLPSTLPTTSGYEWGPGFAVTFKLGSQQGSSQTSNTNNTTPAKSTTTGNAGK
ncbi:MAG: hypothetical protein ABSC77_11915 [Terracidiphilus sp.]